MDVAKPEAIYVAQTHTMRLNDSDVCEIKQRYTTQCYSTQPNVTVLTQPSRQECCQAACTPAQEMRQHDHFENEM
jgi:hypothetical protein